MINASKYYYIEGFPYSDHVKIESVSDRFNIKYFGLVKFVDPFTLEIRFEKMLFLDNMKTVCGKIKLSTKECKHGGH